MSGIGLVWSIAQDALSAQRYGMDVTAHNIANVNTPGYSRQTPIYEAKVPGAQGQLLLGRGVDVSRVMRITDQFIEDRLMQQKSNLMYSGEMANYAGVLEGVFNENSETSVSAMMADFWNLWHDISNNPSGTPERNALYQHSLLMTAQFNSLDAAMKQLETDLTNSVSSGIAKINQIAGEIAAINKQIVGMETGSIANDLRDRRNDLLTELSGYVDTKNFEQDNGTLTIVTVRGCILVHGTDSYDLSLGGANGDRVEWLGSGGTTTDITDYISTGKLGGWLDMRDQTLAKYKLDLDALAKEFAWTVNRQHAQGIGLAAIGSTTGSYAATLPGAAVGTSASGLSFYDKIADGSFKLWLYDENGNIVDGGAPGGATAVAIDADVTHLSDVATLIDTIHANIAASVVDGKLQINTVDGYTFAFSDDTSNVLAALGINTFFSGASAGGLGVNGGIGNDINSIAAAVVNADGSFTSGDNRNAIAVTDLQYATLNIPRWTCDRINGNTKGSLTTTVEDYYHTFVGSVGIAAAGISRDKSFNAAMVSKLGEIRDGISAVSLDEEMTNLMKYQHAYVAASKLISVADEMLKTLLEVR